MSRGCSAHARRRTTILRTAVAGSAGGTEVSGVDSSDKQELQKAITKLRKLSTELRAEGVAMKRRPRQQMYEWADQALSAAYVIEHQLERLEGKADVQRRRRDPGPVNHA